MPKSSIVNVSHALIVSLSHLTSLLLSEQYLLARPPFNANVLAIALIGSTINVSHVLLVSLSHLILPSLSAQNLLPRPPFNDIFGGNKNGGGDAGGKLTGVVASAGDKEDGAAGDKEDGAAGDKEDGAAGVDDGARDAGVLDDFPGGDIGLVLGNVNA